MKLPYIPSNIENIGILKKTKQKNKPLLDIHISLKTNRKFLSANYLRFIQRINRASVCQRLRFNYLNKIDFSDK